MSKGSLRIAPGYKERSKSFPRRMKLGCCTVAYTVQRRRHYSHSQIDLFLNRPKMPRFRLAFLCRAFAMGSIALSIAVAQQRCEDVTKLDVRNLVVQTSQRTFAFRDGVAVNGDGPLEREAVGSRPDWEAEITMDR